MSVGWDDPWNKHSLLRVEQCCAAGIDTQSAATLMQAGLGLQMTGVESGGYTASVVRNMFDLDAVKDCFTKQCNAMKYQAALMTREDDIAWVTHWTFVAMSFTLPQFSGLGDEFSNIADEQIPADRLAKLINAYDFDRDHQWASTHGVQIDAICFTGQCLWKVRRLDRCTCA